LDFHAKSSIHCIRVVNVEYGTQEEAVKGFSQNLLEQQLKF
jgi:hypothetical protein